MQKLNDWFLSSYHSDKTAFYLEIAAAIFSIIASLSLAIHAHNPDMRWIYPLYFVGGVTGTWACLRRSLVWPLILNIWFCFVNILGWCRAMEIL
jgi:hypothetical protein